MFLYESNPCIHVHLVTTELKQWCDTEIANAIAMKEDSSFMFEFLMCISKIHENWYVHFVNLVMRVSACSPCHM